MKPKDKDKASSLAEFMGDATTLTPHEYTMKVLNSANITHSISKHILRAIKDRAASEDMPPTESGRLRPKGSCFAGAQCLANDTGLPKGTVVDGICRLVFNCYLKRVKYFHPNGGQGSSYLLLKAGNDTWVNPPRKRRKKKRKVIGDTNEGVIGDTNEGVIGDTNEGVIGDTDGGVPCDTDDITMQLNHAAKKEVKPPPPQSTQNLQQTHAHVRRTRVERIQDSQNREAHQTSQPTPPLEHTTATGVFMGESTSPPLKPARPGCDSDRARKFVRDWEERTGHTWNLKKCKLRQVARYVQWFGPFQRTVLLTELQMLIERAQSYTTLSCATSYCLPTLARLSAESRKGHEAKAKAKASIVPYDLPDTGRALGGHEMTHEEAIEMVTLSMRVESQADIDARFEREMAEAKVLWEAYDSSQSHNGARKFVRDWENTTGVNWCLDTMSLEALSKPLRSLDDRERLTLITVMQAKMEKVKGRSDRSQWGKNKVENPTSFCRDILVTASEKAKHKARTAPQRPQVPPVDAEHLEAPPDSPTPHLDNVVSLEERRKDEKARQLDLAIEEVVRCRKKLRPGFSDSDAERLLWAEDKLLLLDESPEGMEQKRLNKLIDSEWTRVFDKEHDFVASEKAKLAKEKELLSELERLTDIRDARLQQLLKQRALKQTKP